MDSCPALVIVIGCGWTKYPGFDPRDSVLCDHSNCVQIDEVDLQSDDVICCQTI